MDAVPTSLRDVFCEALARSNAQDRAAYLDQVCQGQPDLRRRVEALLQPQPQGRRLSVGTHRPSGYLQAYCRRAAETVAGQLAAGAGHPRL